MPTQRWQSASFRCILKFKKIIFDLRFTQKLPVIWVSTHFISITIEFTSIFYAHNNCTLIFSHEYFAFSHSICRKFIPLGIIEEGSYEKDVLFYVNIGEPIIAPGTYMFSICLYSLHILYIYIHKLTIYIHICIHTYLHISIVCMYALASLARPSLPTRETSVYNMYLFSIYMLHIHMYMHA